MTLDEFRDMVASLPASIPVARYKGLKDEFPKVVWGEARIEQIYASNGVCAQTTIAALEYMTFKEDDPNVQTIIDMFRNAKMPFVCEIGLVEDGAEENVQGASPGDDYISYMFNVLLEEDV